MAFYYRGRGLFAAGSSSFSTFTFTDSELCSTQVKPTIAVSTFVHLHDAIEEAG